MRTVFPGGILLAVVAVLTAANVAYSGPSEGECVAVYECGDVNASGEVTATDALRVLLRAVLALPSSELICECTAGDPSCPSDLQACELDLGTCDTDRSACSGNLTSCETGLAVALADLLGCGENFATCAAERETCAAGLSSCEANLTTATGQLTTCDGNLSTCTNERNTCSSNLTGCETERTTCSSALQLALRTLSNCESEGADCIEDLGTCGEGLSRTAADLATCESNLADVESQLAAANDSLSVCTEELEACQFNETTTTIPPTTTLFPTTTVTLPPAFECNIIFAVEDAASYGSLQFDVDYADAPGGFAGSDGDVECAGLAGDIPQFNDKENQQILTAGTISVSGFDGPADVAECTFNGTIPPVADDFAIEVTDATDPNLDAIVPTPVVFVRDVDCASGGSTTTLPNDTTTTTTTSSTSTSSTSTTSTSTTSTTEGSGENAEVVFSVESEFVLGSLQIAVDYSSAAGSFAGDGENVLCEDLIGGSSITAYYNDVDTKQLNLAVVAIFGFNTPSEIARCRFDGTPLPEHLPVSVVQATDTDLNTIDPSTVVVTATILQAN